jgi:hypothetical protein
MGNKLDPQQLELYRATDEILHYIWDPIGVSDAPHARDEYRGYLPQVFKMLIDQSPEEKIVNYLIKIETDRMGLNPNSENAKRVVEILYEYKEKIFQPGL